MIETDLLKKHWFMFLILVLFLWFVSRDFRLPRPLMMDGSAGSYEMAMTQPMMAPGLASDMDLKAARSSIMPYEESYAPNPSADRLVIQDTWLSMVVTDVRETISGIRDLASGVGGYMVNSQVSSPEGASSGSIDIRIPADQRDQVLAQIRDLGVKVVNEQVSGGDVTDQYSDLDARLQLLRQTQSKFQALFEEASEVQDLLEVQRELTSIQAQIDSVIGQQQFLEQSAQLTKVNITLSTDELALPYTPDKSWRPAVVFKQAVRSMILSFRSAGNTLIWLAVYSVFWLPLVIVYVIGRKIILKRRKK